MKEIHINASRKYTVTIGNDLLSQIGHTVRSVTKATKVCIVTDRNLRSTNIYYQEITDSLKNSGLEVFCFTISAGESSKNAENYFLILNFLAQSNLSRNDCIIAFGGGVVGDLAGFAAATYLRGIPYIQVPTSLLAMVDSSVGGKTGIDLPAGKNLAGAFYQPSAVICSTNTLDTLSVEEFRSGCAEVIKYAILFDTDLFAHLEEYGIAFDRQWVISRCIDWKRKAIEADEFDTGKRMLLNLGHTIGHAVETCSNYTISHGQGVAIGTAIVCRASHCIDAHRITSLFTKFQLPISTEISATMLASATLSDKKRIGNSINLIIPESIGRCTVVNTPTTQLQAFIEAGL